MITRARMLEASVRTTNDPKATDMRDMVADAVDPSRTQALNQALADIRTADQNPDDIVVRTAARGEAVSGELLARDQHTASVVTPKGVIVVDQRDVPETGQQEINFKANRDVSQSFAGSRSRGADFEVEI